MKSTCSMCRIEALSAVPVLRTLFTIHIFVGFRLMSMSFHGSLTSFGSLTDDNYEERSVLYVAIKSVF